jgi:hypothetical protein
MLEGEVVPVLEALLQIDLQAGCFARDSPESI